MRYMLLFFGLILGGCAAPEGSTIDNQVDLRAVGLAYLNYSEFAKQPPLDAATLLSSDAMELMDTGVMGADRCRAALASGKYTILWGFDVMVDPMESHRVILGYHVAVPQLGGAVLYANGSVKVLTREQFAASRLVGDEPEEIKEHR